MFGEVRQSMVWQFRHGVVRTGSGLAVLGVERSGEIWGG